MFVKYANAGDKILTGFFCIRSWTIFANLYEYCYCLIKMCMVWYSSVIPAAAINISSALLYNIGWYFSLSARRRRLCWLYLLGAFFNVNGNMFIFYLCERGRSNVTSVALRVSLCSLILITPKWFLFGFFATGDFYSKAISQNRSRH